MHLIYQHNKNNSGITLKKPSLYGSLYVQHYHCKLVAWNWSHVSGSYIKHFISLDLVLYVQLSILKI